MCSFLFFLNHSTLLDRAVRQGLDRLELVPGLADRAWTGWSWGQGWQRGSGQVGAWARAGRQGLDRLELGPGLADRDWTGWSWGQGWQTGPGQVGAGHDGAGQAGQGGSVLGTINRS